MPRLVALDVAQDDRFAEHVAAVWERGDAVCVPDPRLGGRAREAQLAALSPTHVRHQDGTEVATGARGSGLEPGDALVVCTSGSTGSPRAVVLTADAVAASASASSRRLGVDARSDGWLCCLPCAHVGGFAVVARALLTGTPLQVQPGFDPVQVARAVSSGATLVSLVPTALARLADPGAFRTVLLGGAAPPESVPPNVVVTWGMTETGSGVAYDGIPLDGVDVACADGELYVRGPMLARCYRDGASLRTRGPDGRDDWFATGDAGAVTDGRVEVRGRIADVITTGGEKVFADEVERVLASHDKVRACAVWKRADPEWGERVVAWVVPTGEAPELAELRDLVRTSLASWAAPRELIVVDELPLTASGKVDRRALAAS